MTRARHAVLLAAAVVLLAGCAEGSRAAAPTWKPKPSFRGEGGQPPGVPGPNVPVPPGQLPGNRPTQPTQPKPAGRDPAVVATKLAAPVGLTLLPDGSALVGERTTGRIVRVQPVAGKPVRPVRTLAGIDATGDGGLLDLALSPHYDQDSLVYAYITTARDNRVVTFTLKGPVTPVLTGIPKGRTGNTGRLAFGAGGDLFVGTGDAGRPALAADAASLAGKVLRVTDIGWPATGNPSPSSPVFTTGHRVVNGLCALTETRQMLEVDGAGPDGLYDVNLLAGDASYGWPAASAASTGPIVTLPSDAGAPGGCAVLEGVLYVTSLDGRELLSTRLRTGSGAVSTGPFGSVLKGKYGRLRTVVADPRGALWLTTSNRDGHGVPVAADERVIRVVPAGGGGGRSPA